MSIEEKKLEIFGVFVVETGRGIAPALVLSHENVFLPIYVGMSEAISIKRGLSSERIIRPLSHDLILEYLDKRGLSLEKVLIDDLEEGVYFAQLILSRDDEDIKIDARPSDCLALASRRDVEIFIDKDVLDDGSRNKKYIENRMKRLEDYLE